MTGPSFRPGDLVWALIAPPPLYDGPKERVPGTVIRASGKSYTLRLLLRDGSSITRRTHPRNISPRDPQDTYDAKEHTTMPMYLGKAVSDDYLQALIGGYRDGYKTVIENFEDGDQPIIDRLSAEKILTKEGATDLGVADAKAKS